MTNILRAAMVLGLGLGVAGFSFSALDRLYKSPPLHGADEMSDERRAILVWPGGLREGPMSANRAIRWLMDAENVGREIQAMDEFPSPKEVPYIVYEGSPGWEDALAVAEEPTE